MSGFPRYRDPELGAWLRERRTEAGLSRDAVSEAAWVLGVPLHVEAIAQIERGQDHPHVYHVDALMVTLGLTAKQRKELVHRWGRHPRWNGEPTWENWGLTLAGEDPPVAITRRQPAGAVGSKRLRSEKEVEVASSFKLRMTPGEFTLLSTTAGMAQVSVSELVRQIVVDAIDTSVMRYTVPSEDEPRTREHNVRIRLDAKRLQKWRKISHGLPLATWVYYIVFDAIRNGRGVLSGTAESRAS